MKPGRTARKVPRDGPRGSDVDTLASSIKTILRQVGDIEARAREFGIFTGDRELLSCLKCGLMEDVLIGGQLITCHGASDGQDTGLRFIEPKTSAGRFKCPECGSEVAPDDVEMRAFTEARLQQTMTGEVDGPEAVGSRMRQGEAGKPDKKKPARGKSGRRAARPTHGEDGR